MIRYSSWCRYAMTQFWFATRKSLACSLFAFVQIELGRLGAEGRLLFIRDSFQRSAEGWVHMIETW